MHACVYVRMYALHHGQMVEWILMKLFVGMVLAKLARFFISSWVGGWMGEGIQFFYIFK